MLLKINVVNIFFIFSICNLSIRYLISNNYFFEVLFELISSK